MIIVSALLCFLLAFSCTTRVAGPATEETNPTVAGTIFTYNKTPAAFARIIVYPKSAHIDSTASYQLSEPEIITTADENGYFEIVKLSSGEFVLEAQGKDKIGFAIVNKLEIILWNCSIRLDTILLSRPGSISGIATRGGVVSYASNNKLQDGFIDVFVKDINRHTTTDLQGKYELNDIPPGTYTLIFHAEDGFFTTLKDSVKVLDSTVTKVESVFLKRIPWLAPPKPFDLKVEQVGNLGEVRLTWKAYSTSDLVGFEVERRINPLQTDTVFTVKDPFFFDDLSDLPAGIIVYYVVRSISSSFMSSANEGPVTINTPQEADL
ncbi:MAG TPA: carboxypeptidase-like regulatory domain-containing protein [Chitinispirillaceae bacterium]|nr:carboxypeptidase-like regulatory domain-containing protein [Chitinispirillaceae bacterium]